MIVPTRWRVKDDLEVVKPLLACFLKKKWLHKVCSLLQWRWGTTKAEMHCWQRFHTLELLVAAPFNGKGLLWLAILGQRYKNVNLSSEDALASADASKPLSHDRRYKVCWGGLGRGMGILGLQGVPSLWHRPLYLVGYLAIIAKRQDLRNASC
jgi:hypothetical protein